MKKTRVVPEFLYDGLGFPVLLINVPVVEVRGIQVPDINYNLLQRNVLLGLSQKPQPLTGNEVRFIRQYLQMTYTDFAKKIGVTHACVIHWEQSKNSSAKIAKTTEICIRMHILDEVLKAEDKLFRKIFRFLFEDFIQQIKTKKSQSKDYLIIESLVAI